MIKVHKKSILFYLSITLLVILNSCGKDAPEPRDSNASVNEFTIYIQQSWEIDFITKDNINITNEFLIDYPDYLIEFWEFDYLISNVSYLFQSNYTSTIFPKDGSIEFSVNDNIIESYIGVRSDTILINFLNVDNNIRIDEGFLELEFSQKEADTSFKNTSATFKYNIRLKRRTLKNKFFY